MSRKSHKYKPKILIVADRCSWAYHIIQDFVITNLSENYDFFSDFIMFYPNSPPRTIKAKAARLWSLLKAAKHRKLPSRRTTYDIVVLLGFYFPFQSKISFRTRHLVKGIYTAGFPPQGVGEEDQDISIEQFVNKYLGDADALICGSGSIADYYLKHFPRVYFAAATVDEDLFAAAKPKTINRTPELVVGWTGNPARHFKGFHDYIVPAVKAAAKLRPGIKLKTRFEGPLKTLPRFYDDVDVVLIASVGDAGPSMFIEAAFCDVPSIAVNSGVPGEIIRDEENGLLVDRNVNAMRDALVRLYDDRELLFSFAGKIREDALKVYGRKALVNAWYRLFEDVLAS